MPIAALAVVFALVGTTPQDAAADSEAAVRLLDHAQLSAALQEIAGAYPDVATLDLVGHSREGRAIEAMRLTAPGEHEGRPALLLIANLEGPRVFESGVVLHHAERLAAGYAEDERVRELLDSTVVWIIPRANPDAAEWRFATPRHERWAGTTGVDNDRDGRQGEDPPADVDGDGLITQMRVRDPDGRWMADPSDERALVEADRNKGQTGVWKLHTEGRDLDGDEEVAEDPAGDTRVDKNFPSGWEQHTPEAGLFATDEPEVRALCEFVMERRNLALVLAYDGQDDLVEKPDSVKDDAPRVKRVPPPGLLESDAKLLEEIGERYRATTENEAKGMSGSEGTFTRWCYDHRGLVPLEVVLWNMPTEPPAEEEESADDEGGEEEESTDDEGGEEEGGADDASDESDEDGEDDEEPSEDAKHLSWIDGAGEDWRFIDWTPFEHPELGLVEIGGFAPYAKLEPPADEWQPIADRQLDFLLTLGALLPRVTLAECVKEEVGDEVWKVTAVVANDAFLPLLTTSAQRTRTTRPARVRLHVPEAGTLLSGNVQALLRDLPGSGGRQEYTWLVHGPEGMEIGVSVDTDHAGETFRTAEVTR